MNRRQFMQGILATACAPAIVRADSLMRIVARDTTIVLPRIYCDSNPVGPNWLQNWMDEEIRVALQSEAHALFAEIKRGRYSHPSAW